MDSQTLVEDHDWRRRMDLDHPGVLETWSCAACGVRALTVKEHPSELERRQVEHSKRPRWMTCGEFAAAWLETQ